MQTKKEHLDILKTNYCLQKFSKVHVITLQVQLF